MEGTTEIDLCDLLPKETEHPLCFDSVGYSQWETEIAEPALRALGYDVKGWRMLDGDSFGPLVRGVTLIKDGVRHKAFYG